MKSNQEITDATTKLKQHKFNQKVPAMSAGDRSRLKDDIKNNGLKVPIVLHEEKILDGWQRYNICVELNIPIRTENYTGDSPQFHCVSLNYARRHLMPSQLAALAVELLPSLERDAKARQLSALKQNRNNTPARGAKNGTTDKTDVEGIRSINPKGKSREAVSKLLGVSAGYVQKAKKIQKSDPLLFEELKKGSITFREAGKRIYQKREAKRKDTTSLPIRTNDERCLLMNCDLTAATIADGSLDAIICDPPYGKKYLDCWKKLGRFAATKLKKGGVLLAMTGSYYLPEVIENLRADGLYYYWTIAYHMTQMGSLPHQKKVRSHWKPLLWYVKGVYRNTFQTTDYYPDVLTNCSAGKEYHKWGQSLPFFTELMEKFTYADELVCDPFVGGGTTAIACLSLKRRFVGIDVDRKAIETTSNRIKDWEADPVFVDFSEPKVTQVTLA